MDHHPNQLSGGQQQRVAIARALINEPQVLLADEPTGNLDSKTSVEIMGVFQKLNAQGITIVMVTHELDIAHYCKRNLIMRDGRLVSDTAVTDRLNAAAEMQRLLAAEAEAKEHREAALKNIQVGADVDGVVRTVVTFGAFIDIGLKDSGLVHISQLSEDHVNRVKDVLKVGQEVEARVIKVDKVERRIGLSIKAMSYSDADIQKESAAFEALKPSTDLVGLEQAFKFATEEWRPGGS